MSTFSHTYGTMKLVGSLLAAFVFYYKASPKDVQNEQTYSKQL